MTVKEILAKARWIEENKIPAIFYIGHSCMPFIYYCSQAVHVPHEPPATFMDEKVKGSTVSAHGDMINELDLQIGTIVDALKKNGQYENTLIIFSSDNGGLDTKNTESSGHDSSNGFIQHFTFNFAGKECKRQRNNFFTRQWQPRQRCYTKRGVEVNYKK